MAPKSTKRPAGRVVYSSELGRVCSTCGRPIAQCKCAGAKERERPEADGVVRVRREKKGRGGKTVTVVTGVPGDSTALKKVAKRLKQKCGVGGTVKDWEIVIQGDQADTVVADLRDQGFQVKRAGG